MVHPLILPELLENIFSFLAKDKALYPTLFANHLWYHRGALILWRHIEFFIEGYRQSLYSKNIWASLSVIKKVKKSYVWEDKATLLLKDAITDRCISEITRSCPKLKYISLALQSKNITDASVIEIARACSNLVYLNLSSQLFIKDVSLTKQSTSFVILLCQYKYILSTTSIKKLTVSSRLFGVRRYMMAELREKLYIGFEPEEIYLSITKEDKQLFYKLIAGQERMTDIVMKEYQLVVSTSIFVILKKN
ncbi:hypothetical protein Glove_734g12 [Diversispora epigaea]|uniref:F-box domain-containing protein n=1 Tax=Diversispora epigaea TaxID=1348612 RepID=A0A397G484_9GLOM|nr:hypothetical protein Glove_734g12 [Diversispora epigaea]